MDDFWSDGIFIALGDGTGGFSAGDKYSSSPGLYGFSLEAGDFDGDSFVDLVALSAANDPGGAWKNRGVEFLKGHGDGTFDVAIRVSEGDGNPGLLAVADLAGNGRQDLLVSDTSSVGQLVFADGGISIAPLFSASSVYYPTVGDFNGDHASDIAVLAVDPSGQPIISIYLNGCP